MERRQKRQKTNLRRIYIADVIRAIALSLVSIYVPIYLLTLGYSLTQTIVFYAILHSFGLLVTLLVNTPRINKHGLIKTIKGYYPLEIFYYILLLTLPNTNAPIALIAMVGGAANVTWWIPLNILLLKNVQHDSMGSQLSYFFALPKVFGIVGPLLSALLIPLVGFVPVFIIAIVGLILSYIPLAGIEQQVKKVHLQLSSSWKRIRSQKRLFILEAFDNIVEESEWFWGIYVYLIIGSLALPGVVGGLEALGGALFTVFVGRYVKKYQNRMIIMGGIGLVSMSLIKMFVTTSQIAYVVTLGSAFLFTLFLVPYFSGIYKTVKGEGEEEFIILREIPTTVGRLIVFAAIIITTSQLNAFFILPIIVTLILLGVMRKTPLVQSAH